MRARPELYALTLYIVLRKNNLFLALLQGISAVQMKIIDVMTSRFLLIFLENFRKIYNHKSFPSHTLLRHLNVTSLSRSRAAALA